MANRLDNQSLKYTGKVQPKPGERDSKTGALLYPYLPSLALIEAVNLAIYLERPLLLKGEPGCGKTQLAQALTYELNLPFEAWHIKSTSQARDGLYTFDAVGRLRDAQLAAAGHMVKNEDIVLISNPETYVKLGPFGRAFLNQQRTIVLIDEIDKADIDFPNDLLLELDEKRFFIEETGQEVRSKTAPIVLITSNDEKDLPDAFLRRCLFHYVEFPDTDRLRGIICSVFPNSPQVLVEHAVTRFEVLRKTMQEDKGKAGKKVSTSELIDWFKILQRHSLDETIAQLKTKLPFPGILLKSREDQIRYVDQHRER
ncbi:MAG: MoxR family ATPase [Cyanothece sp. SIO1E1]|nr:MoxR family ATPase [Cyanothece sp. SIO1E1]